MLFDEKVKDWAPEHYVTISGVSTVKTEILQELMEQLKPGPTPGTITDLNVQVIEPTYPPCGDMGRVFVLKFLETNHDLHRNNWNERSDYAIA